MGSYSVYLVTWSSRAAYGCTTLANERGAAENHYSNIATLVWLVPCKLLRLYAISGMAQCVCIIAAPLLGYRRSTKAPTHCCAPTGVVLHEDEDGGRSVCTTLPERLVRLVALRSSKLLP